MCVKIFVPSRVAAENPLQGGTGSSGRPGGAVPLLQRHVFEWRSHPRPQVLLRTQDRRHGESEAALKVTLGNVVIDNLLAYGERGRLARFQPASFWNPVHYLDDPMRRRSPVGFK